MLTRDEILSMPPEKINELVCALMEPKPSGKTIAELRRNYFDWRYSTFSATSDSEWWKAEIGTDINLVDGQFDKKYDDCLADWKPNKFPAYSIESAWRVAEKILDFPRPVGTYKGAYTRYTITGSKSGYKCNFQGWGWTVSAGAETAPLAVCRATMLISILT